MTERKYTIGIIGGGSVGLTFAAFLADTAHIIIKTRSKEQAEELKAKGLHLTHKTKAGAEEQKVISAIEATSDVSDLAQCDAVIVTVKSYDTESVAKELSPVLKDTAEVLTVQNGLVGFDLLKSNIKNPERVFDGVTYLGSTRLNNYSVFVGETSRAVADAKATVIGEVLQASLFDFESTNEVKQAVWDKMLMNTAQNALGALTGFTMLEMGNSEECWKIMNNLIQEFEHVAKAEGVTFAYSLMDKLKGSLQMSHHPSMWQDLQSKKRTEIDAINGAISNLGKKHGIATPYNDMITSLIKIIEKN
jgi:2-dehydropantoate 2-reductase